MKKIKPHVRSSLIQKVLRLLAASRGVEECFSDREEISLGITTSSYYNHRQTEAALLEAERKKAQAIMERERRPLIC